MIHGPKETKARRSQPVITLYRLQKPARKPASFEEPVSETRCFHRFAIRSFPVGGCTVTLVRLQIGEQRRKSVIRDTSGVDHRTVTILRAPIWFTGRRHCTVFRHLMQLSLLVLR